jgi:hypothetical protein
LKIGGHLLAELFDGRPNNCADGAFADHLSFREVDPAHARVSREIKSMGLFQAGDRLGPLRGGGGDHVAALRRRVEIGCKESRLNELLPRPSRDREEIPCLTIAGGDRSGLVENQSLDVACGFDRLPGRG